MDNTDTMRIELTDVAFRYGSKVVLEGVNWEIGSGATGLLGPNGAGKTTLLHLLTGITHPSQGKITSCGAAAVLTSTDRAFGRRIGFVPQHFTFAAEMRVLDTITYAAWVNGAPRAATSRLSRRALELVELSDKANDKVKTLSGGQRQRLGVASALAHEPELLILDEPTVGLDPSQRLKLREVIAAIGRQWPVVLSTHLVEDITHLCGRVGILAAGRMAFDDDVNKLAALVEEEQTGGRLGSPFEQAYAGIIARIGGSRD